LDKYRSFLGKNRLRFLRAIRWMYRPLDHVQTVISNMIPVVAIRLM